MKRLARLLMSVAALMVVGTACADGLECGFDTTLMSAYVWRNSITTDRGVWMPCIWADYSPIDRFWVGGWVNQVWDITTRRAVFGIPQTMNENDFDVHIGVTAWRSDDDAWRFDMESGFDWYVYRFEEGFDIPTVGEFRLKPVMVTPWVSVYGEYVQSYMPMGAPFFAAGLLRQATLAQLTGKESDLLRRLTVELDGNVSFGSSDYLSGLYGIRDTVDEGIGGYTLKLTIGYRVCDHVQVSLVGAYTSVLSSSIREHLIAEGADWTFRDLPWGSITVTFDF